MNFNMLYISSKSPIKFVTNILGNHVSTHMILYINIKQYINTKSFAGQHRVNSKRHIL